MSSEHLAALTRRRFLTGAGALAGAVALGACGGDDEPEAANLVLAEFFGEGQFAAGEPLRATFSVADAQGVLTPELAPAEVVVGVYDYDGNRIGQPITVARRSEGLPRPYFAVETTIDRPGTYLIKAEEGLRVQNPMAIKVEDPATLRIVRPGQPMPALQTPTTADARGVTPVCTQTPTACPLHDVSLDEALQEQRPIVLIISSPYFCKVAICGPVHDLVLGAVDAHPDIRFLHAEVYADPYNDPKLVRTAPIMAALMLPLEPVLYLVGSDGVVQDRLDAIFDTAELTDALSKLS